MGDLNVFGSAPAGLVPFDERMGGGDDFRIAEHVGAAGIFTVHGPKDVSTSYGPKTAISCDVVILKADGTGTAYSNALIFNAAPVDQLKPLAGQTIVAMIDSYETKQGGKAPRLAAPSEAAIKAAETYQAAASKPPF